MARPKGIPAYTHHQASGRAVVRLNGKDFYLGFYGTPESKAEYDRLIKEWLANGRQVTHKDQTTPITINGMCIVYLEHASTYYRKNGQITTEYGELEAAVRLLHDHCGMSPAAEFSRKVLKTIRETAIARGWKRKVVNARVSRIKRIIHWAADEELVPASVYHDVLLLKGLKKGRSPAPESDPVEPVPLDDFEATLRFCPPIIADMARIQHLAAMRPGEICSLRSVDIDTTETIWVYVYREHKTAHRKGNRNRNGRRIWFGRRAQEILTPYMMDTEGDPEKHLFSPIEAVRHANAEKRRKRKSKVQPSQISRVKPNPKVSPRPQYDDNSYRRAIQRAVERHNDAQILAWAKKQDSNPKPENDKILLAWAKKEIAEKNIDIAKLGLISRWFPNQLRHTRATEIRAKYGPEFAQVILGHESINTTEIYAEQDEDKAIRVMREIG